MTSTTQVSGVIERIATVAITWLLTWLTTKGWISTAQAAEFMPLLLAVITAVYGWWITRDKAILQNAAAVPGTVVVTTPELSAATPDQNNIVSSSETKVVTK